MQKRQPGTIPNPIPPAPAACQGGPAHRPATTKHRPRRIRSRGAQTATGCSHSRHGCLERLQQLLTAMGTQLVSLQAGQGSNSAVVVGAGGAGGRRGGGQAGRHADAAARRRPGQCIIRDHRRHASPLGTRPRSAPRWCAALLQRRSPPPRPACGGLPVWAPPRSREGEAGLGMPPHSSTRTFINMPRQPVTCSHAGHRSEGMCALVRPPPPLPPTPLPPTAVPPSTHVRSVVSLQGRQSAVPASPAQQPPTAAAGREGCPRDDSLALPGLRVRRPHPTAPASPPTEDAGAARGSQPAEARPCGASSATAAAVMSGVRKPRDESWSLLLT